MLIFYSTAYDKLSNLLAVCYLYGVTIASAPLSICSPYAVLRTLLYRSFQTNMLTFLRRTSYLLIDMLSIGELLIRLVLQAAVFREMAISEVGSGDFNANLNEKNVFIYFLTTTAPEPSIAILPKIK